MKVALVHDWLINMGGAERLIKIFHELFPEAPIYTLFYDRDRMPAEFQKMDIRTSWLQNIPYGTRIYQHLLPLMPMAVEQFDLSEYDLVLSSSTCCAKGVITRPDTLHICYCNTPMRYAWDFYCEYTENKSRPMKLLIAAVMNYIRLWDRLSADRVDYFIANSNNVRKRIYKHYRRDSTVIYPGVDTDFYTPSGDIGDYYLIVSRLVGYKKVDLAVKAFNELGLPLVVVGDGPELAGLKKMAKNNIRFTGRLSDEDVREYYRKCRALIFPAEEDFGLVPLEAQSCGRPVIAYGRGGALETVIEGKTGVFFSLQTAESLKEAVLDFEKKADEFDEKFIRLHALRFGYDRFKKEMIDFIKDKMNTGWGHEHQK